MKSSRVLIAVAALAVSGVLAVVIFVVGGSDGATGGTDNEGTTGAERPAEALPAVRSELTLERAIVPTTGQPEELVVSLPAQRLNALETTGGATRVLLRCVEASGAETLREAVAWPLLEEAGFPPHIHQPIRPDVLDGVRGCRLTGPGIDFEGRVPGRVPSAE